MATDTARAAAAEDEPLPYGTPRQVADMLDGIGRVLRDERQEQWRDADLCAATEAMRDHLTYRLRRAGWSA